MNGEAGFLLDRLFALQEEVQDVCLQVRVRCGCFRGLNTFTDSNDDIASLFCR